MGDLFANNPYYVEYESRLKQLNSLMAEGKSDTDEAEAVRDAMDTPWMRLTQAEQARLNGLSADLYMLQDDETFEPAGGRTKIQIGQAIFAAMKQENWEEALALMRKPNLIPKDRVATFRAKVYDELGHHDTALLFLNYAIENTKNPQGHLVVKLFLMLDLGYTHEIVPEAEQLLAQESLPDFQKATVAIVLALIAKHLPELQARSIYTHVASILERILEGKTLHPSDNEILATIYISIGYCYFVSGDVAHAYTAYDNALKLDYDSKLEQIVNRLAQMNPELAR